MAKHVFVLGAGASAAAGAPLMWNFLDVAEDLRRTSQSGVDEADFALVFEGIHFLRRAHSNAQIDTDNIESVLAAFEMAALFGRLGELEPEKVARLPRAMRRLIVQTIEKSFRFACDGARLMPPAEYSFLAQLVRALTDRGDRVAVITFNYDLGADHALFFHSVPFSYALDSPAHHKVTLLKLHGSLNWSRRDENGPIIAVEMGRLLSNLRVGGGPAAYAEFSRMLRNHDGTLTGDPVIVPPTWSKMTEYQSLQPVWQTAARELDDAENIFVSGFSLPASDAFFRMLFALGTTGRTRIRRFQVHDPGIEQISPRFEELLGQAALPRFSATAAPFHDAVRFHIPKDLKVDIGWR